MESPQPIEPAQSESVRVPKQKLSVPVAIIIGAVIIGAAIFFSNVMRPVVGTASAPAVNIKDVTTAGEPFIGNPNAPAIAYFSDFQCPFCKKFDQTILPTLKTEYVDTGKIKIVFKDFDFLGADSTTAALFGRAVWSLYPDQYYAWREAMYNAQDGENTGFGDRPSIEKLTATIPGIDEAKVSAAVDANSVQYQKLIDASYANGQSLGVEGTPSIIIGKTLLDGGYGITSYTDAISKGLK